MRSWLRQRRIEIERQLLIPDTRLRGQGSAPAGQVLLRQRPQSRSDGSLRVGRSAGPQKPNARRNFFTGSLRIRDHLPKPGRTYGRRINGLVRPFGLWGCLSHCVSRGAQVGGGSQPARWGVVGQNGLFNLDWHASWLFKGRRVGGNGEDSLEIPLQTR